MSWESNRGKMRPNEGEGGRQGGRRLNQRNLRVAVPGDSEAHDAQLGAQQVVINGAPAHAYAVPMPMHMQVPVHAQVPGDYAYGHYQAFTGSTAPAFEDEFYRPPFHVIQPFQEGLHWPQAFWQFPPGGYQVQPGFYPGQQVGGYAWQPQALPQWHAVQSGTQVPHQHQHGQMMHQQHHGQMMHQQHHGQMMHQPPLVQMAQQQQQAQTPRQQRPRQMPYQELIEEQQRCMLSGQMNYYPRPLQGPPVGFRRPEQQRPAANEAVAAAHRHRTSSSGSSQPGMGHQERPVRGSEELSQQFSGVSLGHRPSHGRGSGGRDQTQAKEGSHIALPPARTEGAGAKVPGGATRAVGAASASQQQFAPRKIEQRLQLYAIDVECVATGPGCSDRAVAQIAVVDIDEQVVLNVYVKPSEPVFSYLTDLTGLTEDVIKTKGVSFDRAMALFSMSVPGSATLLSYNIDSDLKWLGFGHKVAKGEVRDLKGCYQLNPTGFPRSTPLRRAWGQDHIAKVLLGIEAGQHDAVGDACKSMKLWHLYQALQAEPEKHKKMLVSGNCERPETACGLQDLVDSTTKDPSFAMRHPTYDGVCMGNRKTCTCLQRLEGLKRAGEQKPSERSEEQNQTVSREVSKDGSDGG